MTLLVVFTTVLAYTCAYPTSELLHPSPVNPDVLVAIKPEEKVILITDPKEIARFKKETTKPFHPTRLPTTNEHFIGTEDHSTSGHTSFPLDTHEELKEKKHHGDTKLEHSDNKTLLLKETTPPAAQHKRDIPVPLEPKYHHSEESANEDESDTNEEIEDLKHHKVKDFLEHHQYKRDTSVSLAPEYHHSVEASKDSIKQESHKRVPLTPKETQQQKDKASIKETDEFLQQQKRESPISTNSGFAHNKKEVKSEINDHKPVIPNVKKEDTSSHKLSSDTVSNQNPHKLNIQNDNINVSGSANSPRQHHLARPHPVPVAELFAN